MDKTFKLTSILPGCPLNIVRILHYVCTDESIQIDENFNLIVVDSSDSEEEITSEGVKEVTDFYDSEYDLSSSDTEEELTEDGEELKTDDSEEITEFDEEKLQKGTDAPSKKDDEWSTPFAKDKPNYLSHFVKDQNLFKNQDEVDNFAEPALFYKPNQANKPNPSPNGHSMIDTDDIKRKVLVTLWKENILGPSIFTANTEIFHTVLTIGNFNLDYGRFGIRVIMVVDDERMCDGSLEKIGSCYAEISGNILNALTAPLYVQFRGKYYHLCSNSCLNFTLCMLHGIQVTSAVPFEIKAKEVVDLACDARESYVASIFNKFTESPSSTRKLSNVKWLFDKEKGTVSFRGRWWWA